MTSVPEGIVAVPVHQSARTAARDEGSRMSWWVLLHYQCPHPRTFPSRWDGEERSRDPAPLVRRTSAPPASIPKTWGWHGEERRKRPWRMSSRGGSTTRSVLRRLDVVEGVTAVDQAQGSTKWRGATREGQGEPTSVEMSAESDPAGRLALRRGRVVIVLQCPPERGE